jgi:ATP-binding cassette subfamily B protein
MRESADATAARLNNDLQGVATIKAHAGEEFETHHLARASLAYRRPRSSA